MARLLEEITYTEVEAALGSSRPVAAILPVGATESHGPHLPLNTDVIISMGMARRAADMLEAQRVHAFVLPPLAYTPAEYAADFPGTVSIRPETLGRMLDDIAASLKSQGFACLVIANSHFDPENVTCLREAEKRIAATGLPVAYADATRRSLAATLTEEFQGGDCHGGQFETSIVLAERPDLVNESTMHDLPPVNAGLVPAIKRGDTAKFKLLGMSRSYCGTPAGASAHEGEQSLTILAQALVAIVLEKLGRKA